MDPEIIFLPSTPWAWESLWQVVPGQIAAIMSGGQASLFRMPFPGRSDTTWRIPAAKRKALLRAERWIFPMGTLTQRSLGFLAELRRGRRSSSGSPQAVVFSNGEGARAGLLMTMGHSVLEPGDHVISACPSEARLLSQLFPGGSFSSLPLPVSRSFSSAAHATLSARASLRARHGWARRDLVAVYAGRLSVQKNIHWLLKAHARARKKNPRLRLLLCGSVDSIGYPHLGLPGSSTHYSRILSQAIVALGLEESVRFAGPLSQPELAEAFGCCDLQITLSTHYGEDFGYSVAQGLATGTPSVVTQWGGGHVFTTPPGPALAVPVVLKEQGYPMPDWETASERMTEALENARALRAESLAWARAYLEPRAWRRAFEALLSCLSSRSSEWTPGLEARRFKRERAARLRDLRAEADEGPLFHSTDDPMYRKVVASYLAP